MRKQPYTLIEMLTVIAIIMVLAGLVYPAISSSRTSARAAECVSNQKQVITAIIMSMNANKNYFYSPKYTGTDYADDKDVVSDNKYIRWTARLHNRKYLPDYKVMRCPEVLFPPTKPGDFKDDAFTYGAVTHDASDKTAGFDFRGSKCLRDSSKNDIAPSKLMLGCCSWNTDRQGGALLDLDKSETSTEPYGTMLIAHRGAVNMFFLDGRAAPVNENELKDDNNIKFYYPEEAAGPATKLKAGNYTTIK